MSKQSGRDSRRNRPGRNGSDPGLVDTAVDPAAANAAPRKIEILLDPKPLRLSPKARFTVRPMPNPHEARILVRGEDGLWHGVILPPDSTFELRPSGPAAELWLPPR